MMMARFKILNFLSCNPTSITLVICHLLLMLWGQPGWVTCSSAIELSSINGTTVSMSSEVSRGQEWPKNGTRGAPNCMTTVRVPSFALFQRAVKETSSGNPTMNHYNYFTKRLCIGDIISWREMAMILSHMIHETGGLTTRTEDRCPGATRCDYKGDWLQDIDCRKIYTGRKFYGRGYLQLTYCANYLDIGRRLGLGDSLARDPDRVSRDMKLGFETAFAFWAREVRGKAAAALQQGRFGATTAAINGPLECPPKAKPEGRKQAAHRFAIYSKIYKIFGLPGNPNPDGC